jgi:hypothetical protein
MIFAFILAFCILGIFVSVTATFVFILGMFWLALAFFFVGSISSLMFLSEFLIPILLLVALFFWAKLFNVKKSGNQLDK